MRVPRTPCPGSAQAGNRRQTSSTGGRSHGARQAQMCQQQRGQQLHVKHFVIRHRRRYRGTAREVFECGDIMVHNYLRKNQKNYTTTYERNAVHKLTTTIQQQQPILGDTDLAKPDGSFRIRLTNYNNLAPWKSEGWKLQKEKRLLERNRINISCGTEVGCDLQSDRWSPPHDIRSRRQGGHRNRP